jgi:hypothetical protein
MLFYVSSPKNSTNKWSAFAALLFSFSAIKETYIRYLVPWILERLPQEFWGYPLFIAYSCMEWICGALAPAVTANAIMYICGINKRHPYFKRLASIMEIAVVIGLSVAFPPWSWNDDRVMTRVFWVTFGTYSILEQIFVTVLFVYSLQKETMQNVRKQRRLLALVTLLPLWTALITTYVPYMINPYRKQNLWQITVFVLVFSVIFYIRIAFKNGIMGLKLNQESFEWDSELNFPNKGVQYLRHQVKNQTSKVEICVENLMACSEHPMPEEYGIILRAMEALRVGLDKYIQQTGQIDVTNEFVHLTELLSLAVNSAPDGVILNLEFEQNCNVVWICDRHHMYEVFANIIQNSVYAVKQAHSRGQFHATGKFDYAEGFYILSLTDDGSGINQDDLIHVFEPYFTTKLSESNYGLGLTYCRNVMKKHGGDICIERTSKYGTTVKLQLPIERVELANARHESNGGRNNGADSGYLPGRRRRFFLFSKKGN